MLRSTAEKWLRKRFTFPALVLAAAALLVLSEITYFQTSATLRGGIAWTEARMATARLQQLMTDVESAVRGYLLTGNPDDLAPYRTALAELPGASRTVSDYLVAQDGGAETAERLMAVTTEALAETAEAVSLAQAGQRDAAIALLRTGRAGSKMTLLRQQLTDQMQRASRSQAASRITLFDALTVNRFGVGALAVLSVLGLFVYVGQLHLQDQERNQQQAALARERVRLEDEVRSRTDELRQLASHLQTAREDERARLARELHDELGGLLTAIKLDHARLRNKLTDRDDLKERLDHINRSLNEGIAFKRRIIEDLRPSSLANLGLVVALETLCADMAARLDVPVDATLGAVRLSPEADLAAYRFVQEALTNIGKYAEATKVTVSLQPFGERAALEVRDDGIGFDTSAPRTGHHGLAGMQFRAESLGGRMSVTSRPGEGTVLRVEFPQTAVAADPQPA